MVLAVTMTLVVGAPVRPVTLVLHCSKPVCVASSLDGTQDRGTPDWRKRGRRPVQGRASSVFDPALGPLGEATRRGGIEAVQTV
jgi:hypothetical protein